MCLCFEIQNGCGCNRTLVVHFELMCCMLYRVSFCFFRSLFASVFCSHTCSHNDARAPAGFVSDRSSHRPFCELNSKRNKKQKGKTSTPLTQRIRSQRATTHSTKKQSKTFNVACLWSLVCYISFRKASSNSFSAFYRVQMKHITIAGLIIAICGGAEAFSTPSKISHQQRIRVVQFPTQNAGVTKIRRAEKSPSRTSLRAFSGNHGSLILAATEVAEWRQYVPLIVICGVLLDIVLGSPLANTALG